MMTFDKRMILVASLALVLVPSEAFQFPKIMNSSRSRINLASADLAADKALGKRYRREEDDGKDIDFLNTKRNTLPSISRRKWGVDNINEDEYWFDNRIHTFGNRGFGGAFHAAAAPIATKIIDFKAYDGVDVRKEVAKELSCMVMKLKNKGQHNIRVLDLCCGVGMSTRALQEALPNAETIIGVDTSTEMIRMARFLCTMKKIMRELFLLTSFQIYKTTKRTFTMRPGEPSLYTESNAESTPFPENSFDLVTIMYAFHEAPKEGRDRILNEARRLLQPNGVLAVVDISTDYQPSKTMLSGEPYVLEYQKNINRQLNTQKGFTRAKCKTVVPGHVNMWLLQKTQAYNA